MTNACSVVCLVLFGPILELQRRYLQNIVVVASKERHTYFRAYQGITNPKKAPIEVAEERKLWLIQTS